MAGKLTIIFLLLFSSAIYSQFRRLEDKTGWHFITPQSPFTIVQSWDTSAYNPYSQSYLYFNGIPRGAFARHLGPAAVQYGLGLVNATTDSFDISWEMNVSLTGRPVMGKLSGSTGWRIGVGLNNGANQVEIFIQGIGHTTIDTVASDTTKHLYRVKYNKASTTLQAWVDGVRTVNNTSATSTVGANSLSFTIGYEGSNNSIADTGQAPAGNPFKGGVYSFSAITYTGAVDTTRTAVFTGAGENLYFEVTTGGVHVAGLLDYDRADYTDVLNSPHIELGQSPGRDVRNPIWVNTGTRPTFIDTCNGGVARFIPSAVIPDNDQYVESYTNAEGLYKTTLTGSAESTWVVVGGTFNTVNVTNYRAMGDSAFYIAKYNINTKKWSSFKNSQLPNNTITSVCQWDTSLIAGGSQDSFKTVTLSKGLARWNGTDWTSLDSGFNASILRVRVFDDTLYAGGDMTLSGATSIVRIGKIARGGEWRGFGTGMNTDVYDIVKYNNEIYAGGTFTTANGVTVNGFAKWNGTTFVAFGTGLKLNSGGTGYIFTMRVYNGELYGGGRFDSVNGIPCSNLFKYNGSTFTAVSTSNTFGTSTGDVAIIDLQTDSTYSQLWGVGQFSKLNGKTIYKGFVYNGTTFTALPFQDMRPEGIVIANNQTANIRYFLMGDQMGVYGVNVQNIFEFIPEFTR